MNVYRAHVQDLSSADLLTMWEESIAWEATGALPEDALIRETQNLALPLDEFSPVVLHLDWVQREVWRELAARAVYNIRVGA